MIFFKRKLIKWILGLSLAFIICIFLCYKKISHFATDYLYNDANKIPYKKVALLLGTSRYTMNGNINLFFKGRIEAAVQLYKAGKIKYIIASGDNRMLNYNEPQLMQQALIENGIPDSAIILDYAGFRTFDSIIRCREIFGQNSFIVISQPFHNERALYIARHLGIDAIGFNATDVKGSIAFKTRLREIFSRVKTIIDIHIFPAKPKFLGEKIELK